MIIPVNNHLLIEPIASDAFMASQHDTYQEVGVVIAVPQHSNGSEPLDVEVGDKVYFDSWMAAKFPKQGSTTGEYYWLVKWEDVRGLEMKKDAE